MRGAGSVAVPVVVWLVPIMAVGTPLGASGQTVAATEASVTSGSAPGSSFDSWWGTVGGGTAVLAADSDAFYQGFFAFDHLFAYGLELALEVGGWYFDQHTKDAGGGSFNLDTHWHFLRGAGWSIYLEGGAGILVSSARVPASALRFNFTPRAGLAVTWRVGPGHTRFRGGARWQHLSNGAIRGMDHNPGLDMLMFHAGATFPL